MADIRIVAVNGSPNAGGNTARALNELLAAARELGAETQLFHIGAEIYPCKACFRCAKKRDMSCAIGGDCVNQAYQLLLEADGVAFGTPVYYSGIAGGMKCFMDRLFFVDSANQNRLAYKAAAPVAVTRRSGGVTAVDGMLHYLLCSNMTVAGSAALPVGFGMAPGEVGQDMEGLQAMRMLGKNMVRLIQSRRLYAETTGFIPAEEKRVRTNFIR